MSCTYQSRYALRASFPGRWRGWRRGGGGGRRSCSGGGRVVVDTTSSSDLIAGGLAQKLPDARSAALQDVLELALCFGEFFGVALREWSICIEQVCQL